MDSARNEMWAELASELEERMNQLLAGRSGLPNGGPPNKADSVSNRGRVRVRGGTRDSVSLTAAQAWKACPVVVVKVPAGTSPPEETTIREGLRVHLGRSLDDIDIYYLLQDKHWATLEPRELIDPESQGEQGAIHGRLLLNLRPDYVLMSKGEVRPSWCDRETDVIEWEHLGLGDR